jgi:adenosylcobinamide kinase/adenosylcobinamide-phosphate guanylyltransferase
MAGVTLITGGVRSGKSAHAIALARAYRSAAGRSFFLATAEALDDEMCARIEHHRAVRPPGFQTLEEPLSLAGALESLHGRADVVVLDCLTLWVSNLLGTGAGDEAVLDAAEGLAAELQRASFASVVVSDEVGCGIVPENALGRRFRDLLGSTNQKIAKISDTVVLMVAGYPVRIK